MLPAGGRMRVPGVIYASSVLLRDIENKVLDQLANVASLPGIVLAAYAMPDTHSGYGFPIGGVAAFDPAQGGVVSAGGVGFDISCGVRTLLTGLAVERISSVREKLAEALFGMVPAGVGATGSIGLNLDEIDEMLSGGAAWAVERGFGRREDLGRIEESGVMTGARPECVSRQAKTRQEHEVGTLGSGNHYLEVQVVEEILDEQAAQAFGLRPGECVVSIHSGSRGLGHQVGADYMRRMVDEAPIHGLSLPDRELACAPIDSRLGQEYFGAMAAAANCALANRQVLTHLTRQAFSRILPEATLDLLFDVSHNTCKIEDHTVEGKKRRLWVHRKGATRSFGPKHPSLPPAFQEVGQPVIIGGSMGTASFVLAGVESSMALSFGSACHGAGRVMSRKEATRRFKGRDVVATLAHKNILIRTRSLKEVAEEAPAAYKDSTAVVDAAQEAGLARKVARLAPLICVKG